MHARVCRGDPGYTPRRRIPLASAPLAHAPRDTRTRRARRVHPRTDPAARREGVRGHTRAVRVHQRRTCLHRDDAKRAPRCANTRASAPHRTPAETRAHTAPPAHRNARARTHTCAHTLLAALDPQLQQPAARSAPSVPGERCNAGSAGQPPRRLCAGAERGLGYLPWLVQLLIAAGWRGRRGPGLCLGGSPPAPAPAP